MSSSTGIATFNTDVGLWRTLLKSLRDDHSPHRGSTQYIVDQFGGIWHRSETGNHYRFAQFGTQEDAANMMDEAGWFRLEFLNEIIQYKDVFIQYPKCFVFDIKVPQ